MENLLPHQEYCFSNGIRAVDCFIYFPHLQIPARAMVQLILCACSLLTTLQEHDPLWVQTLLTGGMRARCPPKINHCAPPQAAAALSTRLWRAAAGEALPARLPTDGRGALPPFQMNLSLWSITPAKE